MLNEVSLIFNKKIIASLWGLKVSPWQNKNSLLALNGKAKNKVAIWFFDNWLNPNKPNFLKKWKFNHAGRLGSAKTDNFKCLKLIVFALF